MNFRVWIIGLLLPWLAGCSALKLAYSQAPDLAYWWLDGYVDFNTEQTPPVRAALKDWFAWHRSTQLPDYAALLATLRVQALQPITPQQACAQIAELERRFDAAFEHALPALADLSRRLSAEQLQHLERRQAKSNAEFRDNYVQPDPKLRRAASIKRTLQRAEAYYGRLDESQREMVSAAVAASPFNADAWLAEREAFQRDFMQTLRQLVAERADAQRAQLAWRALAAHQMRSPRPAYRTYQESLLEYNCAFFARLHNTTTPEQRQRAAARLKDWEDDVRALVQPTAS